MQSERSDRFDDPALKAAVRLAWGKERAPGALKQRIAAIAAAAAVSGAINGSAANGHAANGIAKNGHSLGQRAGKPVLKPAAKAVGSLKSPGLLSGIAAVVLLGIGLGIYLLGARGPKHVPTALATKLVADHDQATDGSPEVLPDLPRGDFDKMSQALKARLGFPVLTGSVHPGTYKLKDATIRQVGSQSAAQLTFKHNGNSISVFSLAMPTGMKEQTNYESMQSGHPVAGFTYNGVFYAVVGSSSDGSVTLDDVKAVRDRLKPNLYAGCR